MQAHSAKSILETAGIRAGVIVKLPCGDHRLTALLKAGDACRASGLDVDAKNLHESRHYMQARGLYGDVSIGRFAGRNPSYIDQIVELLTAYLSPRRGPKQRDQIGPARHTGSAVAATPRGRELLKRTERLQHCRPVRARRPDNQFR